jgi:hypothetical protein
VATCDSDYRVLVVDDPDGNELFFPYPNEPQNPPEGLIVNEA